MGNAEPPESMADGYGKQQRGVQAPRAVMTLMTVPAASIGRHGVFPCRLLRTSHTPFYLRKEEAGREGSTVLYWVRRFLRDGGDAGSCHPSHRVPLAGEALTGSVILYAVYGGLMAALFEETGRYIAMRFLVKPMDFPNAFMYGAGHGGVEAMLLCGVASISNIASVMINPAACCTAGVS